jgi:acyl carrier protein phosphodiesterase
MNYLAHAYLSFQDPEILVGNLISDFVKGKKKFEFPDRIQKGIHLHRLIDNFTDHHEATREAKEFFRPDYRLYSGAFIDVVYDHFLANDSNEFTETSLFDFAKNVYEEMDRQQDRFPAPFALLYPFMKQQNWLFHYRYREGAAKSLGGVVRRAVYLSDSKTAVRLFEKHYQPLEQCYRHFWTAVKPFAQNLYEGML